MDKVDRNFGNLSLLHPIFPGGHLVVIGRLVYSILNKMEKSPNYYAGGVEKEKRNLEVLYKIQGV